MTTIRTGSIDAHAHWAPEGYARCVAQLGRRAGGTGPLSPLMSDLEARLKWLDARGVRMHVLTLTGGMPWQWAPQDAANRLARIVNDAAIEAHKAHPETLRFMIELVGSDRVVIGTDNYARRDVEQPSAVVESLQLPAADGERVLRGNAARLLNLGPMP